MLGTHEVVSSLLALSGEAAICKLVALKALMRSSIRAVENCRGKARQATDVDFIRSKTGGSADRVVVSKLDMGQVYIPVVLLFVADHGEHWGHCVVYPLGSTVTARVTRTRGEFADTKERVNDGE